MLLTPSACEDFLEAPTKPACMGWREETRGRKTHFLHGSSCNDSFCSDPCTACLVTSQVVVALLDLSLTAFALLVTSSVICLSFLSLSFTQCEWERSSEPQSQARRTTANPQIPIQGKQTSTNRLRLSLCSALCLNYVLNTGVTQNRNVGCF